MHHFVTEICTREHDSLTKWCTVGYGTGALWDVFKSKILRSWVDIQYALYPIKYAVVLFYSSWLCVIVLVKSVCTIYLPGLILGLRPANERPRYKVTPSLIGWEQTSNQPWFTHSIQGCFTITRVIVWLLDSFTVLLLSHNGRHLPIRGYVWYPTDSPNATRLDLCNSLYDWVVGSGDKNRRNNLIFFWDKSGFHL